MLALARNAWHLPTSVVFCHGGNRHGGIRYHISLRFHPRARMTGPVALIVAGYVLGAVFALLLVLA